MQPTTSKNGTRPLVIRSWLVVFASVIHLSWAVCLLISEDVMRVAPISEVAKWMGYNQWLASAVYFLSAVCAWWGIVRHKSDIYAILLGIPQVVVLYMGMSVSIEIAMEGVHPDGTTDGHIFFFAQLANSIWLPVLYVISLYWPYWRALWQSVWRIKNGSA